MQPNVCYECTLILCDQIRCYQVATLKLILMSGSVVMDASSAVAQWQG